MDNREGFVCLMKQCGYDVSGEQTPQSQQLINVAWQAWLERGKEVEELQCKIARFKSSFRSL